MAEDEAVETPVQEPLPEQTDNSGEWGMEPISQDPAVAL